MQRRCKGGAKEVQRRCKEAIRHSLCVNYYVSHASILSDFCVESFVFTFKADGSKSESGFSFGCGRKGREAQGLGFHGGEVFS